VADPAPYLLYLGPIRPSSNSDAERIARLVADHASVNLHGTYRVTEMTEADELANYDGAAVMGPDGKAVLYVVDVPYRGALRLDDKGRPTDRTGLAKRLWSSLKFFGVGAFRLFRAWRRSDGAKSNRAKLQLALGLAFVVGLLLVVALGALALIAAIWPDALPKWMTSKNPGPRLTIGFIGVSVTAYSIYTFLKRRTAAFGRVAHGLLRYVEYPETRKEAARAVERAIDRIDELSKAGGPRPGFHLLGYSFGSMVALDALCPPTGTARGSRLDLVTSIATVGCPADFVRLYYPDFYDDRAPLAETVPWHNLFIANDVLGSNFLDSLRSDKDDAPAQGVATRPVGLIHPTANFSFGTAELTAIELLKREGFLLHARYWNDAYKSSIVDALMPLWPPMSARRPRDEVASPERDEVESPPH
jgi:hypothetical protein